MLFTRRSRHRGYGVEIRAEGTNRESDWIVCSHCARHVSQHTAGADPDQLGARCTLCDGFICAVPECRATGCLPFEHRLDQWERRGQGLRYDKREHLFDIFQKNGKSL